MRPIASSSISEAGYDVSSSKLYVRFSSGKLYSYSDVPLDVASAFFAAESQGKFLNSVIKSGPYEFEQVVE